MTLSPSMIKRGGLRVISPLVGSSSPTLHTIGWINIRKNHEEQSYTDVFLSPIRNRQQINREDVTYRTCIAMSMKFETIFIKVAP